MAGGPEGGAPRGANAVGGAASLGSPTVGVAEGMRRRAIKGAPVATPLGSATARSPFAIAALSSHGTGRPCVTLGSAFVRAARPRVA